MSTEAAVELNEFQRGFIMGTIMGVGQSKGHPPAAMLGAIEEVMGDLSEKELDLGSEAITFYVKKVQEVATRDLGAEGPGGLGELKAELKRAILEDRGFKEKEGYFTCPNCGEHYTPKYEQKEDAPEGTIEREQHLTGVCSTECWDEFAGVS